MTLRIDELSGIVNLPALCPRCHTLFVVSNIITASLPRLTISNVRTPCLRCGALANILDGTYRAVNNVLEVIAAPEFTRQMLREFQGLVEQARNQNMPFTKLEEAAAAIHPGLGSAIRKMPDARFICVIILSLLLKTCTANVDVHLDVNKLWDQMLPSGQTIDGSEPGNDGRGSDPHEKIDPTTKGSRSDKKKPNRGRPPVKANRKRH
jgi:hypothetical protein